MTMGVVILGVVAISGTWLGVVAINPILQSLWLSGGGSEVSVIGSLMPAVLLLASIALGAAIVVAAGSAAATWVKNLLR